METELPLILGVNKNVHLTSGKQNMYYSVAETMNLKFLMDRTELELNMVPVMKTGVGVMIMANYR